MAPNVDGQAELARVGDMEFGEAYRIGFYGSAPSKRTSCERALLLEVAPDSGVGEPGLPHRGAYVGRGHQEW